MKSARLVSAALAALIAGTAMPAMADTHMRFGLWPHGWAHKTICIELTDYQIRTAIKARGYDNVYLNVRSDRRIQVRATRNGWVYLLSVNTCTGSVVDRHRLRRG
jgi:hypothetical protein